MSEDALESVDDDQLVAAQAAIYQQMAESIRLAHHINPNSWSVQIYERRIILFISEYTAWDYQREGSGRLEILITAPAPSSPLITPVKNDFRRTESFGVDLVRISVPHLQFSRSWPAFASQHLDAVERLARSVRSKTSRSASFDPSALEEIEARSGQQLPTPAYLEESNNTPPKNGPLDNSKNFWKVSAGTANSEWDQFVEHSCIAINWSEYGDLPELPAEQQAFVAELMRIKGASHGGAVSLWQFIHGMKPGDMIVSTARGFLYGVGTIVGDYELVDDDFSYRHRRKVEWTSVERVLLLELTSDTRSYLSRRATILPLSEEQFAEIVGRKAMPESSAAVRPLDVMRRAVEAHGLTYSDHQLATFFSALQTKGFVVLSGISGTGKSKLAQMFVELMPQQIVKDIAAPVREAGYIERVVGKTTKESALLNFPAQDMQKLPLPDPGVRTSVSVDFDGYSQGCAFTVTPQSKGGTIYRLYFSGAMRERVTSLPLGTKLYCRPIVHDQDAVLSGFRITRTLERSIVSKNLESVLLSNNLFLSVRPDWRDSRALLGYHNPLLGSYEWTDFLRFVLRAAENFRGPEAGRIAWFVILDEMNLAHVEYYFADLLSVLESGRDHDGWTREAIRIERPDPTDDQDDAEVPPATIHLPPNLYIIGTVNMDETTHAFSPKVLDRAFTIELSQVDFTRYPPRMATGGGALTGDERASLLRDFSRHGRFVGIDKAEIAEVLDDYPEIRMWLQNLNVQLARSRMQFGYRVFDEIAAFVDAYRSLLPESSLHEAFDLAVLMKVLPKFSGSAARLERPLLSVLAWCIDPARVPVDEVRKLAETVDNKDWGDRDLSAVGPMPFQETADRVKRMLDTLAVDGFASFG